MTHQQIGIVGTVFANYANEINRKKKEVQLLLQRKQKRSCEHSDEN